MGDGAADAALVVDVESGFHKVHQRRPELAERMDGALAVLDRPGVAAGDGDGRPEVQFLADSWQRRDRAEPNDVAELVRRVGDEFAVEAQDVGGVLGRPEYRSGRDGGADGVQREPERADDAEVPAAAPQRPEQVGVIVGRCLDDVALGGDHLDFDQVVDGEPVLAHEPADAAAQGEAADAGVADDAARGGQAVSLRLVVDVAPQGAALDAGRAIDGIDSDGAHRREVDHDSVVAHRGASHVVAPASYGDLEVAVTGEAHRCGHVGGAAAAGDQSRAPIDGAVPYGPCFVVSIVVGGDHVAPKAWDPHRGWCRHRSSPCRWAHRNIGGNPGEVSYMDFEVRNLDFTAVKRRRTLLS